MNKLSDIELVYRAPEGDEFDYWYQSLADLQHVGILIDPETGDDLEMIGWQLYKN